MKTTYKHIHNIFHRARSFNNHLINVDIYSRHWFNVGFNLGFYNASFRSYHTHKFNYHLSKLYAALGRRSTLKPFEEVSIKVCTDIRSKEAVKSFFKGLYKKGGIYKFTVKGKPNLYYIGSTNDLYRRFKQHTNPSNLDFDKFHTFALGVGWNKFEFAILEVSNEISVLRQQENFYLKKYSPLLNTSLRSSIKIYIDDKTSAKSKDNVTILEDFEHNKDPSSDKKEK